MMNPPFASDDAVWISWKYSAEVDVSSLRHTNVVIGSCVTAGARIHLYLYLDTLGEKEMYCDTDSVIHIQPKGDRSQMIEPGDKLRDMTFEFRPSESISDFVSGDPNNYAYRMLTADSREKIVCKVRDIK